MVLRPSGSGAHPPMWPKPLGDDTTLGIMAGLPPIVALHSPLEGSSSVVVDHIRAGAGVSRAMIDSPTIDRRSAVASLEGVKARRLLPTLLPRRQLLVA